MQVKLEVLLQVSAIASIIFISLSMSLPYVSLVGIPPLPIIIK